MENELKNEKLLALKIARDLHYGNDIILAINNADSFIQIDQALATGRNQLINRK